MKVKFKNLNCQIKLQMIPLSIKVMMLTQEGKIPLSLVMSHP